MLFYDDSKKIGIALILLGLACMIIGVMMFLDRGFLNIGNFSFIMGLISLIGPSNTVQFFLKKSKIQGSVFYFMGLVVMIIGYRFFTALGLILQFYGIYLLFRSFIKTAFAFL